MKGDKHLEGGGEEEAGREKKHLDQCNPRQDVAHADAFFQNGTHTVCFLDADSVPACQTPRVASPGRKVARVER